MWSAKSAKSAESAKSAKSAGAAWRMGWVLGALGAPIEWPWLWSVTRRVGRPQHAPGRFNSPQKIADDRVTIFNYNSIKSSIVNIELDTTS